MSRQSSDEYRATRLCTFVVFCHLGHPSDRRGDSRSGGTALNGCPHSLVRWQFERDSEVPPPTMYLWSTADVFIGETAARNAERQVTGPYRFEVIRGPLAWVSEEAPSELSALLLGHLASG